MNTPSLGSLLTPAYWAVCTLLALAPFRRGVFGVWSFYLTIVTNELPFHVLLLMAVVSWPWISQGGVHSSAGWAALGLFVFLALGLAGLIWRATLTAPAIEKALDLGLGPDWRTKIDPKLVTRVRRRFSFSALLGPFFVRRFDVERVANLRYGDAGNYNLLDVYRRKSPPHSLPVFIHFHGGGFVRGGKNRDALPLIYRLASRGWLCISANYHLNPEAARAELLVDAKKVIAWVRTHGRDFGGDPDTVFVAGGSAGAQLASLAALTANDPAFQPGFETVDTSVTAAVTLYGYYGWHDEFASRIGGAVPPFLVMHGDLDTMLPIAGARSFVEKLRHVSKTPIVFVPLPWAQHSFDLFHSLRNAAAVSGIEAFAAWVRATRPPRKQ